MTTFTRIGEIAGTAAIAFATSTGVLVEAGQDGWAQVIVPIGVAAIVGYFTSRITTESRLSTLESEVRSLRREVRIYYQRRGDEDDDD